MKVETKSEFYKLNEAGVFGNRFRTWNTVEEVLQSGFPGPVGIRYKEPGSPFCHHSIVIRMLKEVVEIWEAQGADINKMSFTEGGPDHLLLVQGELMYTHMGWYFFYSTEKVWMRAALQSGKSAYGLAAIDLIHRTTSLASYEDLRLLFEMFPDAIVEFSTYSKNVGILPRRNTIIWEVRDY